MSKLKRGGITLVEFLIVIAIIGLLLFLMLPALENRGHGRRTQCKNNLKQIGLALHNYHDVYNCFPPAYVADENGQPMHSWRVLILPFIEQKPLYDRYDFSEPWNGPNNSKMMEEFPTFDYFIYGCPSAESESINYMAVVGDGTMWPGEKPVAIKDVTDGTSNTILVVEVTGKTSHWMEPVDLDFYSLPLEINPLKWPGISSHHKGGVNVLITDGSVRFIGDELAPGTLRKLLLRNDGEEVGEF